MRTTAVVPNVPVVARKSTVPPALRAMPSEPETPPRSSVVLVPPVTLLASTTLEPALTVSPARVCERAAPEKPPSRNVPPPSCRADDELRTVALVAVSTTSTPPLTIVAPV